jgi:hypothetical protein
LGFSRQLVQPAVASNFAHILAALQNHAAIAALLVLYTTEALIRQKLSQLPHRIPRLLGKNVSYFTLTCQLLACYAKILFSAAEPTEKRIMQTSHRVPNCSHADLQELSPPLCNPMPGIYFEKRPNRAVLN